MTFFQSWMKLSKSSRKLCKYRAFRYLFHKRSTLSQHFHRDLEKVRCVTTMIMQSHELRVKKEVLDIAIPYLSHASISILLVFILEVTHLSHIVFLGYVLCQMSLKLRYEEDALGEKRKDSAEVDEQLEEVPNVACGLSY